MRFNYSLLLISLLISFSVSATTSLKNGEYSGVYIFPSELFTLAEENGYVIPSISGSSQILETGAPGIPFIYLDIAIPFNAEIDELVLEHSRSTCLEGSYHVRPVPAPRPFCFKDTQDEMNDLFIENARFYESNQEYPGKIMEINRIWDLSGQKVVTLRVYPVQYFPQSRIIKLVEEINYRLLWHLNPDKVLKSCNFTDRAESIMENSLKDMVVNPSDVNIPDYYERQEYDSNLPPGKYEHVIVTTCKFINEWDELVDWHIKKGVQDTVISTRWIDEVYEGEKVEKLRAFIEDANQNWGTIWVLLGGDISTIPFKYEYYCNCAIPSDAIFGDYDNDWAYEVFVGRASVDKTSEISTIIKKILTYEKNPPMTDFAAKALFLGFDLDASTRSENLMENISNSLFPGYFDKQKVYDSHSGNHQTNALNGLNNGPNLVNHSDHCNYYVLGMGYIHHNYSLFIQDILTLSNGSNLGNFYSLGCHSNAYEHDDCIGESYVLAQKGGGTTYIGNSHYGWYTPGSTNTLSCFYDQKFYESLCTHGIYHVGQTLADSKNRNSPKSDYEKFIWKELTLIGEPELPLWMRDPVKVEVDYPDTIQPGSQEFKIIVSKGSKPVQKALVCIRKPEDKIYAHGLTDSEGKKTFAISPSQGSMELTVTGRDILPHEGVVIVGIGTPLTITLDPDSRVITKPGVLGFTATIKNMSSKSCTCQFWSGLILWNGQSYSGNPLLGPKAITLAAGDSLVSHFEHPVTQAAPCTTYSYVADIGKFPNQVLDEASFDFKVR